MSWRIWLVFALLGVLWGLPYLLIKLALAEISPAGIAWGRIALAAAILLPLAWRRGALRLLRPHAGAICVFAFAELVGPFFLIALGETWIGSSLTGILVATLPMLIVVIAPLFGIPERLPPRRLLGLCAGLAGVIVLLGVGSLHGLLQWLGVACVLTGALGYALASIVVQKYLAGVDELGSLAASLGIATVALFPAAWLTAPAHLPSTLALVSVLVLGVVCTALALLMYFYLIHRAGAARAAVITYINPAVAATLGILVLDEPFGIGAAAGLALILLGSWMANSASQVV
ncbi:MAG: DMT family transporter [Sinobacteraceae bacterium]|nr:DMT family transporter [Nevskiaceae bacterium]